MAGQLIEVAKTENGVTDDVSHLRYVGAGVTLCGISIPPAVRSRFGMAPEPSETWYPVARDEADRFGPCDVCAQRIGVNHVVSRPLSATRPIAPDASSAPDSGDVVLGPYLLAAAVCEALYAHLDGSVIVPASILLNVAEATRNICRLTFGDGLFGNMSAIEANGRMQMIREHGERALGDLSGYIPQNAPTDSETTETAQNT